MTLSATSLIGKRALVTGAQQGIGKAAALALAAAGAGADVAINWLDDEATARSVADEVAALGRRAVTVRGSGLRCRIGEKRGQDTMPWCRRAGLCLSLR